MVPQKEFTEFGLKTSIWDFFFPQVRNFCLGSNRGKEPGCCILLEDLLSFAGCEECNNAHSSVCPKHGPLHPIPNRPVLTRARASLPLVLYIDRFLGGVFSKRRIPKRTQFGPVEGPLVRGSELKDCYIHLKVTDALIKHFILLIP